jgi:hypothetical protein
MCAEAEACLKAPPKGQETLAEAVARFERQQNIRFAISLVLIGVGAGAFGFLALAMCSV